MRVGARARAYGVTLGWGDAIGDRAGLRGAGMVGSVKAGTSEGLSGTRGVGRGVRDFSSFPDVAREHLSEALDLLRGRGRVGGPWGRVVGALVGGKWAVTVGQWVRLFGRVLGVDRG